jgi:hypothetical protein
MNEIAQRGGRSFRNLGWLIVFIGFLTMLGGLFLEQTSPPTLSSLGLIFVLVGIGILAREVEKGEKISETKPGNQEDD